MTSETPAPAAASNAAWAPGFYDDGFGMRRWWTGRAWGDVVDPDHVAAPEVRRRNLDAAVSQWVAAGYTVEYAAAEQVVLSRRIPMSFVLNALGVIFTGGLWLIYILVRIGSPQFVRRTLTVQPNGVVRD